jgi:hypothetical protein
MSLLDALKQMKQQTGSLDELASLPQSYIMKMVQTKQIDEAQLAPILSRKAEIADEIANRKALQSAGQTPPTIMEQLMAKNAQSEQPQLPLQQMMPEQMMMAQAMPQAIENAGVAQLPIPERAYAGGGIVAFQEGGDMPARELTEEERAYLQENPYLQRSRAISEFFGNVGKAVTSPRNYNPFAKAGDIYQAYQENVGQPFAAAANRFVNEPVGQQADRFRQASEARQNIGKRMAGVPTTSEEARRLAPAERIVGNEQALYDAERLAKESKRTAMPSVGPGSQVIAPEEGTKKQKVAAAGANAASQESGTSAIDEYAKILRQQGEDATKARQEAKYMRLLEAGLGIMGGTSPYAFTNIGQGAIGAAKGYAEDIKGMRAEERERAKTLGALGMEKEKLGITKAHYENVAKLGAEENAIRRAILSKTPDQIRLIERYMSDPAFAKAFGEMSADKKMTALDQLIAANAQGKGKPLNKDAVLKEVNTFLNK